MWRGTLARVRIVGRVVGREVGHVVKDMQPGHTSHALHAGTSVAGTRSWAHACETRSKGT